LRDVLKLLAKHMVAFRFPVVGEVRIKTAIKSNFGGIPVVAQRVKNPTSIHEDAGLIPGLTQWVKDLALP